MVSPKAASIITPIASVVNPLTAVMSSVIIFVRIPGALSLLSNHPMCFLKMASKSLILSPRVRLSPPIPKQSFWMKELIPIPKTRPIKA